MSDSTVPTLAVAAIPVGLLLVSMIVMIAVSGASSVQTYSPWLLLGTALTAFLLTRFTTSRSMRLIALGLAKSARQILPAIPLLALIGMLSTTWMLSGVVPYLINAGIGMLDPSWFLVVTCGVCALVSVLSGSSWTTIATIGVAFIGIGRVMGVSEAWVAGAIISGAYFGDKVSPLSDTTVLAASSCGISMFRHIRFTMLTTVPAMLIALAVFAVAGFLSKPLAGGPEGADICAALKSTFSLTPWVMVIPALTVMLLVLRVPTLITLTVGAVAGLVGIWVFQPEIAAEIAGGAGWFVTALGIAASGAELSTGHELLDSLVETSGIAGMFSTMLLVVSAMIFGGIMIGTGMLGRLTRSFTRMLRRPGSLVGATVASGLFLNSCTGDQYLSIIIGGNIYRSSYRRHNLADEMLSRTLEDSVSVTSPLIPWNSCGMTQAAVLGVATPIYLPFCIFNIMSPVLSVVYAWTGFMIRRRHSKCEDLASESCLAGK